MEPFLDKIERSPVQFIAVQARVSFLFSKSSIASLRLISLPKKLPKHNSLNAAMYHSERIDSQGFSQDIHNKYQEFLSMLLVKFL